MNSSKKIVIIGGGLYGCLTAFQIASKNPTYSIDLIESSDHLLSAFDPIEIGGIQLNNGFHGIEIPRAQEFYEFLKNVFSADMIVMNNRRGLSILGNLIPKEAKLAQWPTTLKPHFKLTLPAPFSLNTPLKNIISDEYLAHLRNVATRYSDNFEDVKHLLVPWFFPADYIMESNDEGDQFRNKVLSGELISQYVVPKDGLFSVIGKLFEKNLVEKNVHIHFSTKVKFENSKMILTSPGRSISIPISDSDHVFYCASPAVLLKDIDNASLGNLLLNKRSLHNALFYYSSHTANEFENFTEILCADEKAPHFSRLSFPSNMGIKSDKKLVQLEFFTKPETNIEDIKRSLISDVCRLLKLDSAQNCKILGLKSTRDVYFPTTQNGDDAFNVLTHWAKINYPNLNLRNNFGPINMAKAWKWSQENGKTIS